MSASTPAPASQDIKSFDELRVCLAIVAHVAIPVGAGVLLFAHFKWNVPLDWTLLLVSAVALSPFIVPMATAYFKEFPGGTKSRPFPEAGTTPFLLTPEATPKATPPAAMPVETPPGTPPKSVPVMPPLPPGALHLTFPPLSSLPPVAVKVLRTLNRYQKTSTQLWGFSIRVGGIQTGPEDPSFIVAVNTLSQSGLVYRDDRGLVFLTVPGKLYCGVNDDGLGGDDTWGGFTPAA